MSLCLLDIHGDIEGDYDNIVDLPRNATNGDVIKALFPNAEIKIKALFPNAKIKESHKDMYGTPHIYMVYKLDIYPTSFTSDFWNAPYKEKKNE